MKRKYSKLLEDTFIFSLGSLGSKLILFFMVPLYTNCLTAEAYGTADLVFTVGEFITPIISLVIFEGITRYTLSKEYRKEDVLRVGYYVIGADVLIAAIIGPIVGLYKPLGQWKWYLSVYLVISIVDSIQFNYLKACNKNKLYSFLSILKTASMAFLNIYFLAIKRIGVKGYLLANILALLINNILAFILGNCATDLKKSKHNTKLLKEMLWYSSPLVLNNISWWVIQSSDKVMVEYMLGDSLLGIYTVAAKIPALINVIISIFSQAWGISSITEYENANDETFYSNVQNVYMAIVCGACVCYVSFVKIFMHFYVGEQFQDAWKYVPLLLVSAVFSSFSSFYGSLYSAIKKSVNNMLSTFFSAIINILINFALIPFIGVWGAVIGTVVAYFFIAIYRTLDVRRYIHFKINWINFSINCLIVVVQAIFVSLDLFGWFFSIIAIVAFLINNKEIIKGILKTFKMKRRNLA